VWNPRVVWNSVVKQGKGARDTLETVDSSKSGSILALAPMLPYMHIAMPLRSVQFADHTLARCCSPYPGRAREWTRLGAVGGQEPVQSLS
jgi:hypothetical protein